MLALVALLGIVVTAIAAALWPAPDDDPAARTPAASPSPGRAAELDLSNLPIARTLDCGALDDDELAQALGAPVSSQDSYVSGDRVELVAGVTDVAHEDGCRFGAPGATARVWVFAYPVSTTHAAGLVRQARRADGCEVVRGGPTFGDPGLTDVCTSRGPRSSTATHRGLFGDAWLSCSLEAAEGAATPAAVRERAARWCVHVATVLGARP